MCNIQLRVAITLLVEGEIVNLFHGNILRFTPTKHGQNRRSAFGVRVVPEHVLAPAFIENQHAPVKIFATGFHASLNEFGL